MYGCESWTMKKTEHKRIDAFELLCWRRLFESPLDCKEIQPVHSKEDRSWVFFGRTDAEAEAPYFGHLMQRTDSLEKTLMLGKIEGGRMLGASVRHSARGKGHEEGGSTYAKAGSSLRSPPGTPRASTPITRVCLLYYFVLSPTPLTLWGAVPHHLFQRRS